LTVRPVNPNVALDVVDLFPPPDLEFPEVSLVIATH
jgi:hypothetical protein